MQLKFSFYHRSGIKFTNINDVVFLEIIPNGIEIKSSQQNVLTSIKNEDIENVTTFQEDDRSFLKIETKSDLIELAPFFALQPNSTRDLIIKNLKDSKAFFDEIEAQIIKNKENNDKLLKVAFTIVGICFAFNIFSIFDTPLTSIFAFIAGCLITPFINKKLSQKWEFLKDIKIRSLIIFFVLILAAFSNPTTTIGYVIKDNSVLCQEPQGNTGFEKLPLLEPVKLYKDNYKKNNFYKTEMGNYIKENDIAFEGSDEYIKAKNLKAKRDKEIADAKAKKDKEIANAKKQIEKELQKYQKAREKQLRKIVLHTFNSYDVKDYAFDYYVLPIAWYNSTIDQKQAVMQGCAEYGQLSTNQESLDNDLALARTKIKSATNGETLGEYSVWSGFKFK